MTPEAKAEIAAFIKERDEILLAGDIDLMMAFHRKHNPGLPPFSSREVAEAALHKARTGAKTLQREARMESARWLRARGMSTFDDGDLWDA